VLVWNGGSGTVDDRRQFRADGKAGKFEIVAIHLQIARSGTAASAAETAKNATVHRHTRSRSQHGASEFAHVRAGAGRDRHDRVRPWTHSGPAAAMSGRPGVLRSRAPLRTGCVENWNGRQPVVRRGGVVVLPLLVERDSLQAFKLRCGPAWVQPAQPVFAQVLARDSKQIAIAGGRGLSDECLERGASGGEVRGDCHAPAIAESFP